MQVSFWPNVAAPARSQRWLNSLDAKCFPSRDFFPFSALASFASAASMTSLRRWPFDPVRTFPKMKCPRKNTEQLFFSSRTDTSESTKHQIRLWWICWQHTVANRYIEVKFDIMFKIMSPYQSMQMSILCFGCICICWQHAAPKTYIENFKSKSNSMFGTFSGRCPWPLFIKKKFSSL